jgi:hypothetical protein
MRILERLAGHYEAQDVQFGKVFVWRPESVVAECECGKRATYERPEIVNGSVSACECGKDHMFRIRQELGVELLNDEGKEEEDKRLHPWRYWHTTNEDSGIPF